MNIIFKHNIFKKRKILIFCSYYLPGFVSGGPVQTISNIVDNLGDNIDFWILTSDRDHLDKSPYPNILLNQWTDVGKAKVFYTNKFSNSIIIDIVTEIAPDAIYLNSFFARLTIKFLVLRKTRNIPMIPTIIAPRGEFSNSAIKLKNYKKYIYIKFALATGLYTNLLWQASSEIEARDTQRLFGRKIQITVTPNLPTIPNDNVMATRFTKISNEIRFVFLSRITPMKNLNFLLEIIKTLQNNIILDIYGSISDESYWRKCKNIIADIPPYTKISYKGTVLHDNVQNILSQYHFFILPTLGENFGHAIFEALGSGCPVIISDRTMWKDLDVLRAGWSLPLEDPNAWKSILHQCANINHQDYREMSLSAYKYAVDWIKKSNLNQKMLNLFENVIISQK